MAEVNQLQEIWESFAFTRLLKAFRLAVGPGKLVVALIGIALITSCGTLMDIAARNIWSGNHKSTAMKPAIAAIAEYDTPTDYPMFVEKKTTFYALEEFSKHRGVFSTLWNFCTARFNVAVVSVLESVSPLDTASLLDKVSDVFDNLGLCAISLLWAIQKHPVYSVIFLTFVVLVVSFTGGAICRMAALEFSRGEKPGLTEAMKYSWQKLAGFIAAPTIPIVIMVVAGALITTLGVIGNIPVAGKILMSLGLPAALMLGLLISLFLVGTVVGFNLMFPTIAFEGTNGMDAISRSFAYVYAHPWAVTFYGFFAAVYGAISYLVVRFFAYLLLVITYIFLNLGIANASGNEDILGKLWTKPEFFNLLRENTEAARNSTELAASILINSSVLVVVALLIAFLFTFYYSACTIIYSLLREKVDRVSSDKIYIHLDNARD